MHPISIKVTLSTITTQRIFSNTLKVVVNQVENIHCNSVFSFPCAYWVKHFQESARSNVSLLLLYKVTHQGYALF